MNHDNYQGKIVESLGVELVNYSLPTAEHPGKIAGGRNSLETLLGALESNTCKWVKLSADELDARKRANRERHEAGAQVYKPRKAPARKQALSRTAAPKTAEQVESSDDDVPDGDDDDDEDDEKSSDAESSSSQEEGSS